MSQHLSGGNERNRENCQDNRRAGRDSNRGARVCKTIALVRNQHSWPAEGGGTCLLK
jgi:hypothetical protein